MKKVIAALAVLASSAAFSAPAEFPVDLTTPVERADASALAVSEIDGFKAYCGTSTGVYDTAIVFPGAQVPTTSLVLNTLEQGANYCAFTTVDIDGRESVYSAEIILTENAKALPKPPVVQGGNITVITTTTVVVTP